MLPNTTDVESVFNNETGINQFLSPGTIVIDMSTISSTSSMQIGKILQKKQIEFLDAPVSGGVKGAITALYLLWLVVKKKSIKNL